MKSKIFAIWMCAMLMIGSATVVLGWSENPVPIAAPTADAGGPYVINEGEQLILDGSGSIDPESGVMTYAWDLDNDGAYDDATGVNPTVTWAALEALGLGTDGTVLAVGLEVTDSSITGNEYDTGWPYWYVLAIIGIAALIGMICLGVIWLLRKYV